MKLSELYIESAWVRAVNDLGDDFSNSPDRRARKAERKAATENTDDSRAKALRARMRSGTPSWPQIEAAASLGHPEARVLTPDAPQVNWRDSDQRKQIVQTVMDVTSILQVQMFVLDCAARVLAVYEDRYPEDNRPRMAIELGRTGNATKEHFVAAMNAANRYQIGHTRNTPPITAAGHAAAFAALASYELNLQRVSRVTGDAMRASTSPQHLGNWQSELEWQKDRLAQYALGEALPEPTS